MHDVALQCPVKQNTKMTTYHIWRITVINWLVTSVYITAYNDKAARIQYGPCPNLKEMIKSKLHLQPFLIVQISSWTINIDNCQHSVLCIRYLCKVQHTGNPWDKGKSIQCALRNEHSKSHACIIRRWIIMKEKYQKYDTCYKEMNKFWALKLIRGGQFKTQKD